MPGRHAQRGIESIAPGQFPDRVWSADALRVHRGSEGPGFWPVDHSCSSVPSRSTVQGNCAAGPEARTPSTTAGDGIVASAGGAHPYIAPNLSEVSMGRRRIPKYHCTFSPVGRHSDGRPVSCLSQAAGETLQRRIAGYSVVGGRYRDAEISPQELGEVHDPAEKRMTFLVEYHGNTAVRQVRGYGFTGMELEGGGQLLDDVVAEDDVEPQLLEVEGVRFYGQNVPLAKVVRSQVGEALPGNVDHLLGKVESVVPGGGYVGPIAQFVPDELEPCPGPTTTVQYPRTGTGDGGENGGKGVSDEYLGFRFMVKVGSKPSGEYQVAKVSLLDGLVPADAVVRHGARHFVATCLKYIFSLIRSTEFMTIVYGTQTTAASSSGDVSGVADSETKMLYRAVRSLRLSAKDACRLVRAGLWYQSGAGRAPQDPWLPAWFTACCGTWSHRETLAAGRPNVQHSSRISDKSGKSERRNSDVDSANRPETLGDRPLTDRRHFRPTRIKEYERPLSPLSAYGKDFSEPHLPCTRH